MTAGLSILGPSDGGLGRVSTLRPDRPAMIPRLPGPLLALVLLGTTGMAAAADQSGELMHYLRHEGYLNTWPSVSVSLDHDGVATVWGHVESELDRRRLGRIVAGAPGVENVRNHLQTD